MIQMFARGKKNWDKFEETEMWIWFSQRVHKHIFYEFSSSSPVPFVAPDIYDSLCTHWTIALANVIAHLKMIPTRARSTSWLLQHCQPLLFCLVFPYVWGLWGMYVVAFVLPLLPVLHVSTVTLSSMTVITVIIWIVWNNGCDKEQYVIWGEYLWLCSGRKGEWEWDKKMVTGRKRWNMYEIAFCVAEQKTVEEHKLSTNMLLHT